MGSPSPLGERGGYVSPVDAVDDADEGFLRRVYGIDDPLEVRDYYDSWAISYDAELTENGYASPARVANALAGLSTDLRAPVLDYGCGTGLSGEALLAAGFSVVDGADPSGEMLRAAEAKDIYRSLVHLDLDAAGPPFSSGQYAVVAAIGLIGPGAAPLELFISCWTSWRRVDCSVCRSTTLI